jgi:hypothetical protein
MGWSPGGGNAGVTGSAQCGESLKVPYVKGLNDREPELFGQPG